MSLLIRVVSLDGQAPPAPIAGIFNESGGTLGRSHLNTLTLPDPQRMISRLQAKVTFHQGRFWIEDVGAGVVTHVNGVPILTGEQVPLRPRDALLIGGYRLAVEDFVEEATVPPITPRATAASAGARPGPSAAAVDPFADLMASAPATGGQQADPFADLFAPPRADAPVTPVPPLARRTATQEDPFADLDRPRGAEGQAARSILPADFDPFADLGPPPTPAAAPAESAFDLIGDTSNRPGALDLAFGLTPTPSRDALAEFLEPSLNRPSTAPIPPSQGALPDHTPDLQTAYQPPRPMEEPRPAPRGAPPPRVTPAPVAEPAARIAAPAEELWRAFLEGTGLPPSFPQAPTPHVMRVIGLMLRYYVEGTVRLLATRAATKSALRAEMTLVRARDNNPLKFSPNAAAVLTQLLQPPVRGFLAAPEAVRDALNDIQSHQIATMAGMRAALDAVLARFEPAFLEQRLTTHSALEALVPAARKAKLWNLYLEHFEAIREGAKEGFQDVFAKAFVKAYEEQIDRLRTAPRGDSN